MTLKILAGCLLIGLGAMVIVALLSVVGGTIVYWLWPHVIPVVLPKAVNSGSHSRRTFLVDICVFNMDVRNFI